MSKPKTPDIPDAPKFFQDQNFQQGIGDLQGLGNRLTNFDFTGNLSPLAQTTQLDPEVTKLALQYAQNAFTPAFNDTVTGLRNEAASSGALNSSTFTDALAKAGQNLNSQFQATVSQAALQDRERALQNRIGLFGTGLNTLSGATQFAEQNQSQTNQFNLRNYENEVTKSLADFEKQNRLKPWEQAFSLVSPLATDYYKSQGRTGVSGYGLSDVASIAGSFFGMNAGGGASPAGASAPRSSASNNPFQISSGAPKTNSLYDKLYGGGF